VEKRGQNLRITSSLLTKISGKQWDIEIDFRNLPFMGAFLVFKYFTEQDITKGSKNV
jgi:hypothetical protein